MPVLPIGLLMGFVAFAVLALAGLPLSTALLFSVVLVPFLVVALIVLSIPVRRPLAMLIRGPGLLRTLTRLRRQGFDGRSSLTPTCRVAVDRRRILFTSVPEQRFVQMCFAPGEPDVFRLAVAEDGARHWELSEQGRKDLTVAPWVREPFALGDSPFDALVNISPTAKTIAALQAKVRGELLRRLQLRWRRVDLRCDPVALYLVAEVEDGLYLPGALPHLEHLRRTVLALLELIGQLHLDDPEVPERLAQNAAEDPNPRVRRHNLDALDRFLPNSPVAATALSRAMHDPDPYVAMFVARHLGDAWAQATAWQIAARADLDIALRREATTYLVSNFPIEAVWPALASQLGGDSPLRELLVELLGRLVPADLVAFLAVHAPELDGEAIATLLLRLGAKGDPVCEPLLLSLLEHDHPRVRLAAIETLGRVGTLRSIEPLSQLASAPHLSEAVGAALRHLHERWHTGGEGRLSVASDTGQSGAVSVAGQLGDLEVDKPA